MSFGVDFIFTQLENNVDVSFILEALLISNNIGMLQALVYFNLTNQLHINPNVNSCALALAFGVFKDALATTFAAKGLPCRFVTK